MLMRAGGGTGQAAGSGANQRLARGSLAGGGCARLMPPRASASVRANEAGWGLWEDQNCSGVRMGGVGRWVAWLEAVLLASACRAPRLRQEGVRVLVASRSGGVEGNGLWDRALAGGVLRGGSVWAVILPRKSEQPQHVVTV